MFRALLVSGLALGIVTLGVLLSPAQQGNPSLRGVRTSAETAFKNNNWKDAYEAYARLALSPANSGDSLVQDFKQAIQSLHHLQQRNLIDEFRASVLDVHADDWKLIAAAAESYLQGPHYGWLVAGDFVRGDHSGSGSYVSSLERDRVNALQLMVKAHALLSDAKPTPGEQVQFYRQWSQVLRLGRTGNVAWKLQALTDLERLPDYEEINQWGWRGYSRGEVSAAPVTPDGNPVLYEVPEQWDTAASDGERWRWTLAQIVAADPSEEPAVDYEYAAFLHGQLGVQTMASLGVPFGREADDDDEDETGPYAVSTLTDEETIARLATGIKRFTLPEGHNFIHLFNKVAESRHEEWGERAMSQLASIYLNRQQYPRAAEVLQRKVVLFPRNRGNASQLYQQITGNWGRIEPTPEQVAGSQGSFDYRFRNGSKVTFTAHRLKVEQLLQDVMSYLESADGRVDWNQRNVENIGYRVVYENETKYRGEQVAQWSLDLDPREKHFDRRVTVDAPMTDGGAYLITANMQNGNTSRVVLWLHDLALVRKPIDKGALYFAADAADGTPLSGVKLDFFGFRIEQVRNNVYRVLTSKFAENTGENGLATVTERLAERNYEWLTIGRTEDGRFGYLGFQHIWYPQYQRDWYNQRKVFAITDRPVYRPGDEINYKLWMRIARYNLEDKSQFAGGKYRIVVTDPQGEEVKTEEVTLDEYGGVAGSLTLDDAARLGSYSIHLVSRDRKSHFGGGQFRLEEYRKPEYEVTVEAPDKPVMLGETITAKIRAKYYFGAPVTNATVHYKVERTSRNTRWFPPHPWDWFYGEGFWWFAGEYDWYPGFYRWGCLPPVPPWYSGSVPPELLIDREVPIGSDGTVDVEIDTELAQALHSDSDHEYTITAEVVDQSRRTIVGTGNVLVARKPFEVFVWIDRGYYRVGDTIEAHAQARTIAGKPVASSGTAELFRVTYEDNEPVETSVQSWDVETDEEGRLDLKMEASAAGQYRLSVKLSDDADHTIEGGYLFFVRGEGTTGEEFRFDDIELIQDQKTYQPGDTVKLSVNTDQADSTVLLFVRPVSNVYLPPQVLKLDGKTQVVEIPVEQADVPNFHIEALTISGGEVHTAVREIAVPPEKRILNVTVTPSAEEYRPGEEATVEVKVTDEQGEPFVGSLVLSVYDRAVEYISGGSNVGDIRSFFWQWRKSHSPTTQTNLGGVKGQLLKRNETPMQDLGVFGGISADWDAPEEQRLSEGEMYRRRGQAAFGGARGRDVDFLNAAGTPLLPGAELALEAAEPAAEGLSAKAASAGPGGPEQVQPAIRQSFADTAYWNATLETGEDGLARVTFDMPEQLTDWTMKTWAMGHGTRVGEATASAVTSKNVLIRLAAPRFFTERDEVVLSAIVHNYLDEDKETEVVFELDGGCLVGIDSEQTRHSVTVTVPADGERRVDWRVRATKEGEASVTVQALTDEESDALKQTFPVYVHGILKTESWTGIVRAGEEFNRIDISVPSSRREDQSRLEIRYSPTLAGAMVDALPYLADYPYGCTEQTLNRFVPTVITHSILKTMDLDLAAIREKRTNLNAAELGDPETRAAQWKRFDRNPVFDEAKVEEMVKVGLKRLGEMQLSDGGWGWFSGYGEHSTPHMTATVVHGLQQAQASGVTIASGVLERGVAWLKSYQDKQVELLQKGEKRKPSRPYRSQADNIDALVYMTLVDAGLRNDEMQRFLYRDRGKISPYALAMFGLALEVQSRDSELARDQLDMVVRNLEQFLVFDDENQTAYLNLPNAFAWWYWYGDSNEANAYFLKLLTRVKPGDKQTAGLVKYILNNRKHGTYWKSTRDTALCIEALAEYWHVSGESRPDMTVEVLVDGDVRKTVEITRDNLFTFENALVLEGADVSSGRHTIQIRRQGSGPLYWNTYLTNFTTEEFIEAAGLEIKVARKFYRLTKREDATDLVVGDRGQAIDQAVEKYDREELVNLAQVSSGDLIEVELEIDSKNDYEYLMFEDRKAAGLEPTELRSGYVYDGLRAYVEYRDEKVVFFTDRLNRGKHSLSYRLRAEAPGKFSALPTRGEGMYAPELRANSDEMKLRIRDDESGSEEVARR